MKIFRKNKYGASSPLEFSIASMALISTIVVVTVTMSPPVEQSAAQFYADANAKATEIMSLVLSPESEVGLAIDPGTSVPVPNVQAITEMTIRNSAPMVLIIDEYEGDGMSSPNPHDGAQNVESPVTLSVVVFDSNPDDVINVTFYLYEGGTLLHESETTGLNSGQRAESEPWSLNDGTNYRWKVNITDGERWTNMSIHWSFSTSSPPPNESVYPATIYPLSGICSMEYVYSQLLPP